jgi:hypothetical protein
LDDASDEDTIEIQLQKREAQISDKKPEQSNTMIFVIIVAFLALIVIGGAVTAIIINQKKNLPPVSVSKDAEASKSLAKDSKDSESPAKSSPDKKEVALKLMAINKVIEENLASQTIPSIFQKAVEISNVRKLKQSHTIAAILQQKEAEKRFLETRLQNSGPETMGELTSEPVDDRRDIGSLLESQKQSKRLLV